MEECGNVFFKKTGREVKIRTGMPQHWVDEAKQKGDLIFEGSESMLNDFMQTFPGVVDESSITGLYARSAAILVRKGNPKSIKTLSDSAKEGMKIVVITQEKMEEVYGRVPGIHYNIVLPLLTGRQAAQAWKTTPELDAWITYESWHYALKDETDLVQLSERERVLRITPVVAIRTSRNREAVREFINFLKTEEAHKIFQKWGWK
jgi:accessory colonization factor AcfC